jgi:hypothetical protein
LLATTGNEIQKGLTGRRHDRSGSCFLQKSSYILSKKKKNAHIKSILNKPNPVKKMGKKIFFFAVIKKFVGALVQKSEYHQPKICQATVNLTVPISIP